jgi:hypothetical protein
VIAAALSEPAGPPVDVGGVVRVEPLSGWEVAQDPPGVRLTRGPGTLIVRAFPFAGDASQLLHTYVEQSFGSRAEQISFGTVEPVRLRSGVTGMRMHYVGTVPGVQTPIEGQLTAAIAPSGVGVVFNVWAPEGLLRFVLDDAGAMIDRAEIR